MGGDRTPAAGPAPGVTKAAVLAAGLSLLLHLGNMFVQGLALLSPAPLVWLYRRHGMGAGRLSVMIAVGGMFLVSLFLYGSLLSGLAFLYTALMALGLGETLTRGRGEDQAVFMGMAGGLLAMGVLAYSLAASMGLGVAEMVERTLNGLVKAIVAGQSALPDANPEDIAELESWLKSLARLAMNLGVGMVIMGSLLLSWLNVLVSRRGIPPGASRPTLIHWRSPEQLVWVFIAGVVAVLLLDGWWKWAGANAALILATVYLLQGLAVIGYYFEKKRVPRLYRVAAYAVMVIIEFLLPVVAAVGLFDIWLNFRRLGKAEPA